MLFLDDDYPKIESHVGQVYKPEPPRGGHNFVKFTIDVTVNRNLRDYTIVTIIEHLEYLI